MFCLVANRWRPEYSWSVVGLLSANRERSEAGLWPKMLNNSYGTEPESKNKDLPQALAVVSKPKTADKRN